MQASVLPGRSSLLSLEALSYPSLSIEQLPTRLKHILQRCPSCIIDPAGRMILQDRAHQPLGYVPLYPTQWNQEHSHAGDRLYDDLSWGIVLHWFGNQEKDDYGIDNFLYGFNGLRQVDDYLTRTSAHFLVGGGPAAHEESARLEPIGILQTQVADDDGTPFVASHLQHLNYQEHVEKKQYFVRALYQLGYQDPTIHSLLQDFFDGKRLDPNMHTLAIEISGQDFEDDENQLDEQKLANVLSVVWACMQRYSIRASDILGHNEITTNKPDPGKKFMALIRLLVGVKALVEPDPKMQELVFGQHLSADRQPWQAVRAYFAFLRDYLVLVGRPMAVYQWEISSGYWFVIDQLDRDAPRWPLAKNFIRPFEDAQPNPSSTFTVPQHHEGTDLVRSAAFSAASTLVRLTASGECLFVGESYGFHPGRQAIFRHRQPSGAYILSVYGNLNRTAQLQAGKTYLMGEAIGSSRSTPAKDSLLHFAIGYGATWESDLRSNPNIPLNTGPTWIMQRYLHPIQFLDQHLEPEELAGWKHRRT